MKCDAVTARGRQCSREATNIGIDGVSEVCAWHRKTNLFVAIAARKARKLGVCRIHGRLLSSTGCLACKAARR